MRKRRSETAVLVLVCGSLAGLLIWSKLRLVSELPRSAYATPREQAPEHDDASPEPSGGEQAPATGRDDDAEHSDEARPESEN